MRGVKSILEEALLGGELNAEANNNGEEGSSEEDLLRLSVMLAMPWVRAWRDSVQVLYVLYSYCM